MFAGASGDSKRAPEVTHFVWQSFSPFLHRPAIPPNLPYLSLHPSSATPPSTTALAVTTRAPASAHWCVTTACGPAPPGCPRCVVPKDLPPRCAGGPRRVEQDMSGDAPCAECRTNARGGSNNAEPRPRVDPTLRAQGRKNQNKTWLSTTCVRGPYQTTLCR